MKHKTISKYGVTKHIIKSGKGSLLDEVAVQSLRTRQVFGLLPVEVHKKRNNFRLIYDVTGLTNFADFIKLPITKSVFVDIIRGILNVFAAVQENHLEIGKVIFDFDSMFVNPARNTLFFIYIPLRNYNKDIRLKDLLLSIPPQCVFSAAENREYVSRFLGFVNTQASISKLDLAGFLNYLEGRQQSNPNQPVSYDRFSQQDGGVHEGGNGRTYDPFRAEEREKMRCAKTGQETDTQEAIHNSSLEKREKRDIQVNGTTVLGDSMVYDEGTCKIGPSQEKDLPYMVRQYTGEKILITCSPFRIGKDRGQCHYYVSDNSAVSRNHADIIIENDRYFIRDNGSTNFTYVNGRRIEQMTKYEITNDTQLRLANEDFTFYETKGEMP